MDSLYIVTLDDKDREIKRLKTIIDYYEEELGEYYHRNEWKHFCISCGDVVKDDILDRQWQDFCENCRHDTDIMGRYCLDQDIIKCEVDYTASRLRPSECSFFPKLLVYVPRNGYICDYCDCRIEEMYSLRCVYCNMDICFECSHKEIIKIGVREVFKRNLIKRR